ADARKCATVVYDVGKGATLVCHGAAVVRGRALDICTTTGVGEGATRDRHGTGNRSIVDEGSAIVIQCRDRTAVVIGERSRRVDHASHGVVVVDEAAVVGGGALNLPVNAVEKGAARQIDCAGDRRVVRQLAARDGRGAGDRCADRIVEI